MALCAVVATWGFWPLVKHPHQPFSRRIPLYEAMVHAYDQLREKPYGAWMYGLSETAEARLTWLCNATLRYVDGNKPLLRLYGSEPPGTGIHEIYMQPLNSYSFEVENHTIILKANYGDSRRDNLLVLRSELATAINALANKDV
jgi:hypothetical protein